MTLLDENGAVLGRGDDAGGNRLIGTPRWKATFSTEYVKPLSSAIDALVQLDVVYTSKVSWSAAYAPRLATPGAAIFGGRIGIRSSADRYGIALFARHLFAVYKPTGGLSTPVAGLGIALAGGKGWTYVEIEEVAG